MGFVGFASIETQLLKKTMALPNGYTNKNVIDKFLRLDLGGTEKTQCMYVRIDLVKVLPWVTICGWVDFCCIVLPKILELLFLWILNLCREIGMVLVHALISLLLPCVNPMVLLKLKRPLTNFQDITFVISRLMILMKEKTTNVV